MAALHTAFNAVRRGGTVSISGVYGGQVDPMPMMVMFDRGITIRMGQCHVKRWIDDIWPVLMADGDPLGVESLATHRLPLDEAPERVRDVPEEGRRLRQGGAEALTRPRRPQIPLVLPIAPSESKLEREFPVALVIGASRGLGLLIARELDRQGFRVVIASEDRDELDRAAEQLRADGARVATEFCDVADEDAGRGAGRSHREASSVRSRC